MNLHEELNLIANIPESDVVSRTAEAIKLSKDPEVRKEIMKYGKVPVVYIPHKESFKKRLDPGLSVLIENAMTVQEVNNLLEKGKFDYKNARCKTIRNWEKVATKRINEITAKK